MQIIMNTIRSINKNNTTNRNKKNMINNSNNDRLKIKIKRIVIPFIHI